MGKSTAWQEPLVIFGRSLRCGQTFPEQARPSMKRWADTQSSLV